MFFCYSICEMKVSNRQLQMKPEDKSYYTPFCGSKSMKTFLMSIYMIFRTNEFQGLCAKNMHNEIWNELIRLLSTVFPDCSFRRLWRDRHEVEGMGRGGRKVAVLLAAGLLALWLLYGMLSSCNWDDQRPLMMAKEYEAARGLLLRCDYAISDLKKTKWDAHECLERYVVSSDRKVYSYDRYMPLIFIGGVPRSGTTLMRAMLDAHPDVRCGQETRVIPRILQMRSHWLKSQKESLRLEEAGLSKQVLDSAIAAFCLEIIARHGDPAPRLCNKDPLTLKSAAYLAELFPHAKFIFMLRDGRATVHSIISRKVTITGFDLTSYRQCLTKWNAAIQVMHNQCREVGSSRCLMVHYEQLVLHPREWMHRILDFLEVPWNETVLHHEEHINKPGGVSLSKVERSSDQVIKPVYLDALTKWVGNIPDDVVRDMADIAPMLSVLGYDPYANPPAYGSPDSYVADNTKRIRANGRLWEDKAKALLEGHLDETASDTPAAA